MPPRWMLLFGVQCTAICTTTHTHSRQGPCLHHNFLKRHVFAGMSQWLCLLLMQSDKRQLPPCPLLPVLLSLSAQCGCTVVAGTHAHTLFSLKIEPNSTEDRHVGIVRALFNHPVCVCVCVLCYTAVCGGVCNSGY